MDGRPGRDKELMLDAGVGGPVVSGNRERFLMKY